MKNTFNNARWQIFKWLPWHVMLVAVALVVLMPIIYLFAAGFRTNQAIYGPFLDTNTWSDSRIANKQRSRISRKRLFLRIRCILAGYSEDEISDKSSEIDKKRLASIPTELTKSAKRWIRHNGKDKYRDDFLQQYQQWKLTRSVSEGKMMDSQLFDPYDNSLLYRFEIRSSFQNYFFFFTGKITRVPNITYPIFRWFLNSLFIAAFVSLVQTAVVTLAAYVISRFRYFGRRAGMLIILTLQIFPSAMSMVALFLLLTWIGKVIPPLGIDTKIGLSLVYLGIGIPLNIWIAKGYFDTIPRSIEESAIIDGATNWQVFIHIFLPLLRPVISVLIILSFVAAYNEFLFALVLITREDNFTLPVALSGFMWNNEEHFFGIFAAASCIGSIPIVVLWLLLQKQIIAGLTRGAIQ